MSPKKIFKIILFLEFSKSNFGFYVNVKFLDEFVNSSSEKHLGKKILF